jgi:hypothetical protein
VGAQLATSDHEAIGAEAFLPVFEEQQLALFALEERTFGPLRWELGAAARDGRSRSARDERAGPALRRSPVATSR